MFDGLNVTFHTTQNCNLRCKYCYEVHKGPGDLKFEYAQKFINDLLDDPDPCGVVGTPSEWLMHRGVILDFIGGDALINPKFIDDVLKYFMYQTVMRRHRWANNWRASVSTNGTLFADPKVQALLEKYDGNFSVGVSVDGCPAIHDKNRVFPDGRGTIEEIRKWWPWYLKYSGPSASTKATLNSDSIPYLSESIKFLHEDMGLQQISMNFIFEKMDPAPDLVELERQLEKTTRYILDHRNDLYVSLFDKRNTFDGAWVGDTGWCGSGAMPCLSVDGKYYPCFRFTQVSIAGDYPDMSVGDVWTGFSRKENFRCIREQTREKISPQKCRDCEVQSACAWCIAGAYSESGQFYRQTHICDVFKLQCKWSKIYWSEYIRLENG